MFGGVLRIGSTSGVGQMIGAETGGVLAGECMACE